MKKGLILALFLAMVVLQSCTPKDSDAPSVSEPELHTNTQPADVEFETMASTGKDDEDLVFAEATYVTPKFSQNSKAMPNINEYYALQRDNFNEVWQKSFVERARAEMEKSKASGGNFMPYTANVDYEVLKNSGGYLSIRSEIREFTGGARESNRIRCENWERNKDDYARISLGNIFTCSEEEARKQLLDFAVAEAQDRADEIEGIYFDDFAETMRNVWEPSDFYITESGIGIVFQEYTIGPATTGLQTFEVNYADLTDLKEMNSNK